MAGPLAVGSRVRALPPFDLVPGADDMVIVGIQFLNEDWSISGAETGRWQYLVEQQGQPEPVAFAPEYVEPA